MKLSLVCAAAVSIALSLAPATGLAQTEKAKALFNVGAAAYNQGNYVDAIRAFEDAYKVEPRPGILFSLAQAHKRQYSIDHVAAHLHAAVKMYREYLGKVGEGGRRADAAEALAELDPIEQRLGQTPEGPAAPVAPPKSERPRLMATSDVKGALISIDAAKERPLPQAVDLEPGKHKVHVTAPGFFDYDREIEALEGGIVPLDVNMKERPAVVVLTGESGAQIAVDGRPSGTTPLAATIELSPGRHFIAITKTGHKPFTQEVDLARGDSRPIDVKLERTGQRYASYVFLGAGAAGVITGVVLGVVAAREQSLAQAFLDKKATQNVTQKELDDYATERDARDNFRRYGVVAAGAGIAVGVAGALLYIFDQPAVTLPALRPDDRGKPSSPVKTDTPMEISAAPIVGPGALGGMITGRF